MSGSQSRMGTDELIRGHFVDRAQSVAMSLSLEVFGGIHVRSLWTSI
jgi:hypothetical protein